MRKKGEISATRFIVKAFQIVLIALISLCISSAYATNITIYDKMGTGTGWYGAQEDQSVEPGTQTGAAMGFGGLC